VKLPARCGRCGATFLLGEVVEAGTAGRCPSCGELFAPDYTPVLAAAVRQLLAAADAMDGAVRQLRALAPALRIDVSQLPAELDTGQVEVP
jgi:hypothetical protein